MKPIGGLTWPTAVSMLGLVLSLRACLGVLEGRPRVAIVLLIYAGPCDAVAGWIARRRPGSELERAFGTQLDSIVDIVSFGLTPAMIGYSRRGLEG